MVTHYYYTPFSYECQGNLWERLRRSGGACRPPCPPCAFGGSAPSGVLLQFVSFLNPRQRWARAHLWTPHAKAAPLTAFSIKEWQSFPPWLCSFRRKVCALLTTGALAHVALCILILMVRFERPWVGLGRVFRGGVALALKRLALGAKGEVSGGVVASGIRPRSYIRR